MKNTICPLAWHNLAQTQHGSVSICSNNIVNMSGEQSDNISTDFQMIRHEMMNDIRPAYCQKCFIEEDKGFNSKRQDALKNNNDFNPKDENPGKLTSIEIYSDWASDIEDTTDITTITFLENNSLELQSHSDFLIGFVASGQSRNMSLVYNLSSTIGLHNKFNNIWNMFKHVTLNIAIDGIDEKHNWFNPNIHFHKIENHLNFLRGTVGHHVSINVTARVNMLTAPYLDRLALWKKNSANSLNKDGGLINLYMDTNPNLDIRRLPMHLKGYTKLKIERLIDAHRIDTVFNSAVTGRKVWTGLIDYMYSEDLSQHLPDTLNYIKEQDNKNNTNWKEVFPELSDIEDDL